VERQDIARLEAVDMEAVVAARKERGWSQEDLALYLRLPKSVVSKAERGMILCPREIADWIGTF
jgi:ribosome-binding protein aMBF1 (putative translation factor)